MASAPKSLDDLMERINTTWAAVQAGVANLSEAQLNTPDAGGWSIKDNLAHLAAWERALLYIHIEGQPASEVWELDEATLKDMQLINEATQKRSAARSVAAVLAESKATHAKLVKALSQMDFARLQAPRYPNQPKRGKLLAWVIGDTYDHYAEHGAYIQKQVKRLKKEK
jgi:hypothetical protein